MKLLLIFALLSSLLLTSDAAATEHGTEMDEMRLKLDLLSERVQNSRRQDKDLHLCQ